MILRQDVGKFSQGFPAATRQVAVFSLCPSASPLDAGVSSGVARACLWSYDRVGLNGMYKWKEGVSRLIS